MISSKNSSKKKDGKDLEDWDEGTTLTWNTFEALNELINELPNDWDKGTILNLTCRIKRIKNLNLNDIDWNTVEDDDLKTFLIFVHSAILSELLDSVGDWVSIDIYWWLYGIVKPTRWRGELWFKKYWEKPDKDNVLLQKWIYQKEFEEWNKWIDPTGAEEWNKDMLNLYVWAKLEFDKLAKLAKKAAKKDMTSHWDWKKNIISWKFESEDC